jgi:hypothetical protein
MSQANQQRFATLAWLPRWPWYAWVIGLLAILLAMLFEGSYRASQKRREEPPEGAPLLPSVTIKDSGNSSATATGNSHSVTFPPFQPAPPVPEVYFPVNVGFEPSQGQFDKMYLRVVNHSEPQMFQAQCKVMGRRNDPNPQHFVTFPLNWEHPHGRALYLLKGESGNLLIASAGQDRSVAWIKLESASAVPGPESRWSREPHNENLPEYDLEITVLGQQSKNPQQGRLTLRAGTNCALELYKPSVKIITPDGIEIHKRDYLIAGTTTIPRARIQVFIYGAGRWYPQGDAQRLGDVWSTMCWFGAKTTLSGAFKVVAIADGNINTKPENHLDTLPSSGTKSNEITVNLKRQPMLSDLV